MQDDTLTIADIIPHPNNDKGGGRTKLREKDLKLAEYISQGLTVTDAAKLVGLSRTQASTIKNHKLNKYKLSCDYKLLKKSTKCVHKIADDFLTDKTQLDGKTPTVRPSDVLRIVEMQQDRIDPVIKIDPSPAGQSISFTQVNINTQFLNNDEPVRPVQIMDITPVLPVEVGEDRDKQAITGTDNE